MEMGKNIFKQFALIILFVTIVTVFFGYEKDGVIEDNENVGDINKVADEEFVESDLDVVEVLNEDQERKPYEFAGIEIDYPEDWYYIEQDIPGGGFLSNKKYLNVDPESSFGPDLEDDEVRSYIGSGPQDSIPYNEKKSIEQILKDFSEEMKKEIEWSCVNRRNKDLNFCKKYRSACMSSGVLENNDQKYILITCRYDEIDEKSKKDKYIFKKGIIYQNPYYKEFATVDTATMYSYDKDLLKESDLDIVFESIKKSVINSNHK